MPSWLGNLINATGDVSQKSSTVHSLLGPEDVYVRFQPIGEAFAVALDDSSDETLAKLEQGADAFMRTQKRQLDALAEAMTR